MQYFLHNAHGDVVQLANTSGTVTKAYDYDAFGVEKSIAPNDTNPFRYCGEYYDSSSGTYYLRNRYYSPGTGRFMTEDPARDGLNWYTYCENSPVNRIDPWGLDSYILYDPNALWFSLHDHMISSSNALKSLYGTPVHKISTEMWNADTFTEWWNGLSDVDAIIFMGHGTSDRIQFDKKYDNGRNDPDADYGMTLNQMSDLKVKDMDMMLLLGCNTGHLDRDNMGMAFSKIVGYNGRVIAPDGPVEWAPFITTNKVVSSSYFKDLRPSNSSRTPAGFIAYFNENGIAKREVISSASKHFSPEFYTKLLWVNSRNYYNFDIRSLPLQLRIEERP